MSRQTFATRARFVLPLLSVIFLVLAVLACNIGAQPPSITATPASTDVTQVAQSNLPQVEIRSPADNTEVVINTEVQVYVHASDSVGVTRIEMTVDNLIVDTSASPDANGSTAMDSILSWTPNSAGPHVIEVVAYRGDVRGDPKQITLTVRDNSADVTNPAGSPAFLTASPTSNPECRVRVNTSNLNVRSGPGINYDRITTLSVGSEVPVTGGTFDLSWYQVNVQGTVGWLSGAYVTQLGVCSNLGAVPIPPSPTVQTGATAIIIPPSFTPLPTFLPPTPSSTIPIIVLNTLTWTPAPPRSQPSAGDLSSTAIYATQTKLAQPVPTNAQPSATNNPNATATTTLTPSVTVTPQLPDLTISSVAVSTNVVLDSVQNLATVPFVLTVSNIGKAPAPVFRVAVVLPDGTSASVKTTDILPPNGQTQLTINVTFTKPGPQHVTIIADSENVIVESNKNNNVAFRDMTVAVATAVGTTSTPTSSPTPRPTNTVKPTNTPVSSRTSTSTVQAKASNTLAATNTSTATLTAPAATTPVKPTTTLTSTPSQTLKPGVTATTAAPSNTPTSTATLKPGVTATTAVPSNTPTSTATLKPGVTATTAVPSNTPTMTLTLAATLTKAPPTATYTPTNVPPTRTPTFTRTVAPPTATFTATNVPPTRTPTFTRTIAPPTATYTPTNVPPTRTPTFTRTIAPPTATHTPTNIPPTRTPTNIPPTKAPPTATFTPTNVPPTRTPTNVPPTVAPPTAAPTIDLINVPILPDLGNQQIRDHIKSIFTGAGKKNNVTASVFKVVGDQTLLGMTNIMDPKSNLAAQPQFKDLVPLTGPKAFGPSIAGAPGPTNGGGFTSADILNKAKGSGPCQGKSPLDCATTVDPKPAVVFISVGRADMDSNLPLDQFAKNLTNAVNTAASRGAIPVLVAIPGSNAGDEAKLAQYNTVIFQLADSQKLPFLNLYALRKDNPATINPDGTLSDPGPDKRADFSPQGLQFGLNDANLYVLELLNSLKNTVPLPVQ